MVRKINEVIFIKDVPSWVYENWCNSFIMPELLFISSLVTIHLMSNRKMFYLQPCNDSMEKLISSTVFWVGMLFSFCKLSYLFQFSFIKNTVLDQEYSFLWFFWMMLYWYVSSQVSWRVFITVLGVQFIFIIFKPQLGYLSSDSLISGFSGLEIYFMLSVALTSCLYSVLKGVKWSFSAIKMIYWCVLCSMLHPMMLNLVSVSLSLVGSVNGGLFLFYSLMSIMSMLVFPLRNCLLN